MSPIVRTVAVGLLAVLCGACTAAEPEVIPPPATWSIETSAAALTARRGDNTDIYLWEAAGETSRLTTDPAQDNYPSPSPDGQWVAFQSKRNGGIDDIFLMPMTGVRDAADITNLTNAPGYDVRPAWSPDGRRIAFMSTRGFELGEGGAPFPGHIYVMNADGGGLVQLTREPLTSSLGPQDWTPDGVGILLSREVDGQLDIFRLDLVTGSETRLTSDPANEAGASVSPDGTTIAFHSETSDASQLVLMGLDGSNRRAISASPGRRYSPRWSPDGRWLVFSAMTEDDDVNIQAIEIGSGAERTLVATAERELDASWLRGR